MVRSRSLSYAYGFKAHAQTAAPRSVPCRTQLPTGRGARLGVEGGHDLERPACRLPRLAQQLERFARRAPRARADAAVGAAVATQVDERVGREGEQHVRALKRGEDRTDRERVCARGEAQRVLVRRRLHLR